MSEGEGQIKIDIGGGREPRPGHVNVDLRQIPEVDLMADAATLPFADNSIDHIHANSLVPHIPDLNQAMEELSRVLSPGGTLVLRATHAHSTGIVADPDHSNWSWTSETPKWYDNNSSFSYYSDTSLELVDVRVRGWARPERPWIRPFGWAFKQLIKHVSPEVADELIGLPFAGGRVKATWRATA